MHLKRGKLYDYKGSLVKLTAVWTKKKSYLKAGKIIHSDCSVLLLATNKSDPGFYRGNLSGYIESSDLVRVTRKDLSLYVSCLWKSEEYIKMLKGETE